MKPIRCICEQVDDDDDGEEETLTVRSGAKKVPEEANENQQTREEFLNRRIGSTRFHLER